jgi:two-component sensor histidine kinase
MNERKRIILLIQVMTIASLLISGITMAILYHTAFELRRDRLVVSAKARARMIEATARFNAVHNAGYPGGAYAATLHQVTDAYGHFRAFGETGELTLGKKEGDHIVWLLSHRYKGIATQNPVPFDSKLAEPMRRALLGESGVMVGPDYMGKTVVAAYEPVAGLNLGLVTKIDLEEVQKPFIIAGVIAVLLTGIIVFLSAWQFIRITRPMVTALESRAVDLENEIAERRRSEEEVKRLNAELEQRVIERTTLLSAANRTLEKEIQERQQVSESLRASLSEKEVLLREVHHRVKNNLAAISGIVQVQRRGIHDTATVKVLMDLEARVRSMAIIHEMLYRSENLARINFQDYLEKLISQTRSFFLQRSDIRFSISARGVEMVLDDALPCGLIVNELITNAIKYAFPETLYGSGARGCEISVMAECEGSAYTLSVADNGIGFPANLEWTTVSTLGLHLVRMLGQHQLGGRIELDRKGGTRFVFTFVSKHRR